MKSRRGQAAWILLEALHQLGRIGMLLILLALGLFGVLGYRLSKGPVEIPKLASRLANMVTGEGVNVHVSRAELAWAGYHNGGAVPFVLRLSDIAVRTDSGGVLADIPAATITLPTVDLFGGREPVLVTGSGATIPAGDVPISWYAKIWPGSGFTLSHGAVYVSVGKGMIGTETAKIGLASAEFVLAVSPDGQVNVTNGNAQLQQVGQSAPRLSFSMQAHRKGLWLGQLAATMDAVQAQDLPALWPAAVLADTRHWVTENITDGAAKNARFTFDMAANGDLSHFKLVNAQGQFDAADITLSWLKGLVPITHMNGVFALPGMDTAVITANSGNEGGVNVKGGSFIITDLTAKDQFGTLSMNLYGRIEDVIAVLNGPPLTLLDHSPKEVREATGDATARVDAFIPFKKNLKIEEVGLNVAAALSDVQVKALITGIDFTNGQLQLNTDGHSLQAKGTADFAGNPAEISVTQNFSAADSGLNLNMKGTAGSKFWHVLGLDTPSSVSSGTEGSAPFEFSLSGPPDGVQKGAVSADLTPAGLALPLLGWEKTPGSIGHLAAQFTLKNGKMGDVQSFAVDAPDMTLRASSRDGRYNLETARIGRSDASGTVLAPSGPGQPWIVNISGTALDVRLMGGTNPASKNAGANVGGKTAQPAAKAPPKAKTEPGVNWKASLAFGALYLAKPPAPALANVSLTAAGQGGDVAEASGKADGVNLSVAPLEGGRRHLTMQGSDAGTLLKILDAYDGMRGGKLDLAMDFGGAPAKGVLKMDDARLVNAPGFIKLLQTLTLYGVAEAISGPGLLIDHATFPFTLGNGVLGLQEANAYSESLGFTASGTINTKTGICDLATTIIPAYAINSLPGKIPFIGRLFSAEKGGGVFAMRAHVDGPLNSPSIHVNPLSAVTPGVLRGIFGLGGGHKADGEDAQPQPEQPQPNNAGAPPASSGKAPGN